MSNGGVSDDDCSSCSSADDDSEPLFRYQRLRGPTLPRKDDGTSACLLPSLALTCSVSAKNFLVLGTASGHVNVVDFDGRQCLKPLCLPSSITTLSMDAGGNTLLACDDKGNCSVFDLRWILQPGSNTLAAMSEETTVSKISYDAPISVAAIDPTYSKKREKTIVVGLEDGRMIVTRRGWLGRRDTVVHQSVSGRIEALAWFGSLVAVADETGVKVINVVTGDRLAHVDRPKGGFSKLYRVGEIKCCLSFESDRSLLIGWGDCIMNLVIEGTTGKACCSWAWALDACCCGVMPIDKGHIGVLGAVDDGGVELLVIARSDGTIVCCDYLPLEESEEGGQDAKHYHLTSTFCIARSSKAEEIGERQERGEVVMPSELGREEDFERFNIMEGLEDEGEQFNRDDNNDYGDNDGANNNINNNNNDNDRGDYDSNSKLNLDFGPSTSVPPKPPIVTVISGCDAIIVRCRDVDDKVDFARQEGDVEKALKRALKNRRLLRRNNLNAVIEEFMVEKLRANTIESVKRAASAAPILLGGKLG